MLQPSALSGENCGYVLERESRLRLGAIGDRAVLGDAELPAARDQPRVAGGRAPCAYRANGGWASTALVGIGVCTDRERRRASGRTESRRGTRPVIIAWLRFTPAL